MPARIIEFEATPNPDAIKCVLQGGAPSRAGRSLRSYSDADAASNDPLARSLLAIPGVAGVLIHDAWFTVRRTPGADWNAIKAGIRSAVGQQE